MAASLKSIATSAALCSALLWGPGVAAAEPFELIELVYAETDHDDNPPGGFDIWAREIVALWQDMLARRAATEPVPSVLPPGASGDLHMEMEIEASHEARVRVTYRAVGRPLTVYFGFVREGADWKIMEIWREGPDGETMRLSELLGSLFCEDGRCS